MKLADLVAHPELVAELARDEIPDLLGELASVQARLMAVWTAPAAPQSTTNGKDRLLTVRQVAERLGVTEDWVYRENAAGRLPFARRLGQKTIRFSERGLERYLNMAG